MVLATEAFGKLVKVSVRGRNAPEAMAVVLKGNLEYLEEGSLAELADKALQEIVRRLVSGAGSCDELIG